MEFIKVISFWLIFAIGFIASLIGVGMLFDYMLKRYMVHKEVFESFLEYMKLKMEATMKNKK